MVQTVGTNESEQRVVDDVAKYGWHCVHILGDDAGGPYSFTVGAFHSFGLPELIVFGLPFKLAQEVLHLAIQAARDGRITDFSIPTDQLLEGLSCVFVEVPRAHYYWHVGYCSWFYFGDEFPLYQIVWPSNAGRFPWHPEATAEFRELQPVLGESPSGA